MGVPRFGTQVRSKNIFGYRAFPVRTVAAATRFFCVAAASFVS